MIRCCPWTGKHMKYCSVKKTHPLQNLTHFYPNMQEGAMYLSHHDVEVLDKIMKLLFSITKTLFLVLFFA